MEIEVQCSCPERYACASEHGYQRNTFGFRGLLFVKIFHVLLFMAIKSGLR